MPNRNMHLATKGAAFSDISTPSPQQSSLAVHVCGTCDARFTRRDHLVRHLSSHTSERPYKCSECGKPFARRDIWKRHLSMHSEHKQHPGSSLGVEKDPLPRIRRACNGCARSKMRCDGDNPCERCRKWKRTCLYERLTVRRAPASKASQSGRTQLTSLPEEGLLHGLMEHALDVDSLDGFSAPQSTDFSPNDPTFMWSFNDPLQQSPFDMEGLMLNPSLSIFDWAMGPTLDLDAGCMLEERLVSPTGPTSELEPRTAEGTQSTRTSPMRSRTMIKSQENQEAQPTDCQDIERPGDETVQDSARENLPSADTPGSADSWLLKWRPGKNESVVSFPDMGNVQPSILESENFGHVERLDQGTFNDLEKYLRTSTRGDIFRAYRHAALPPIEIMNCFIQLYFEKFQPSFPLLHKPSFHTSKEPPLLVLAVAATGCRYSKVPNAEKCDIALQEFLRRLIKITIEQDNSCSQKIWFGQSVLLNILGMTYGGQERLLQIAFTLRSALATICRRNSLFTFSSDIPIRETLQRNAVKEAWELFIYQEKRRRMGFFTFILDCQFALYFDVSPIVALDEVRQPMPCQELEWEARTAQQWKRAFSAKRQTGLTSIRSVLGQRHQDRLQNYDGLQLSGIIHAIYRTTWDISQLLNNPLIQSSALSSGGEPVHSQLSPLYTDMATIPYSCLRWVDTAIHETVFTPCASNIPAIAHFHLVSVLHNAPLRDLICFTAWEQSESSVIAAETRLRRWLMTGIQARRAFFHAGVLFSHVKNFCQFEYYGAMALTVASVTLWAYNSLGGHAVQESISGRDTIRLDKTIDLRLARSWIEESTPMRLSIEDIGDLCHADANPRIIEVACRTLSSAGSWGITQKFVNRLSLLMNSYRNRFAQR